MPRSRLAPSRLLAGAALALVCLALPACGVAESIAGNFVDDESVTLPVRPDRCATIERAADGTDVDVEPGVFLAGDTATDTTALCVLAFAIDPSLQPGNTALVNATLRIWVEPGVGAPGDLGPAIVSHLPGHPDQPPLPGQVPDPPGNDVGTLADVTAAGWHAVDVTTVFLQDWNAGRSLSAFAVRLTVPTDGDMQRDTVMLTGTGSAQLILRFSLDL